MRKVSPMATMNAKMIPCARCEAKVNEDCVTISGAVADEPHTARTEPLRLAYNDGYQAGLDAADARADAE